MATEQEELKLVVTLTDDASAGLEKLQSQIKELAGGGGTGGNKHLEKVNEGAKALTETVMKMTGSFGEAFKSLGMLRLGFIGGVAGLAAFGYEMAKQIKDLGEYTDKIRNLGQLGKDIGVNPAMIKDIGEQLKVFGVTTEQSEAALTKFAQRLAELQRDPHVRLDILEHMTARTPQAQAAMNRLLDTLSSKSVDVYAKLEAVRQAYENIKQHALERGETEERAADEARQGGAALGYGPELARAGVLKRLSDEELKAWKEKQAAAEHYSETLGRIAGKLDSISEIEKEWLTRKDSYATAILEQAERFTSWFLEIEKKGGLAGIYKRALEGDKDPGMTENTFKDRWPGANEQFGPLRLRPGGARLQNQSYRGIGMDGSLLHQAAFVSEEHGKVVDANTEQLKRLNDLLAMAMGLSGSAGAGGGFQNAAFTTGGGFAGGNPALGGATPRGFGGGGYRNLGTTYGSRGGGGGNAGDDGSAAGTPRMTQSKREVAQTVAKSLKAGGMSDDMIAGVMANISDESGFDPNLRHPDQPHFGGEAHFAHGLYQEGGTEWNNYAAWLKQNHPGENWRDPKLQSDFLAQNLQKNYPGLWKAMKAAKSPGEAAALFVKGYLKPRADLAAGRASKYLRGVPGVSAYTGGDKGDATSKSKADEVPATSQTLLPSPQSAGEQPRFGGVSQDQHAEAQSSDWTGGIPTRRDDMSDMLDPRPLGGRPGIRPNVLTEKGIRDAVIRRSLDAANNVHKVEGNAKIRVDVNAPKGTNVGTEASGLFNTIETYRQTQMATAQRGPPRW